MGDDTIFSASNVSFAETSLGGLPNAVINHLINEEKKMIEDDAFEVSRQETWDLFEEELFSLRDDIYAASEGIEEEENTKMIKDVFTDLENWLYDEGEEASKDDYNNQMKTLKEKVIDFLSWAKQIKNKMEHEKRILQQQEICREDLSLLMVSLDRFQLYLKIMVHSLSQGLHLLDLQDLEIFNIQVNMNLEDI